MSIDPDVEHFENVVRGAFEGIMAAGKRREALIKLFSLAQYELTTAQEGVYPAANALELVMRAVIAILRGNAEGFPDHDQYVLENLKPGVAGLLQEVKAPPDVWVGYRWWS